MDFLYLNKDDLCITKDSPVKLTTCGNIIELKQFEKVNRKGATIIQLGDSKYILPNDMDYDTGEIVGEIKQFKRTTNRGQNIYGLKKSMKDLRDLINCNVVDCNNVRWMTFTYAENMTDNKKLTKDREHFWKRVKRWHDKNNLPIPEFISIAEPQGRGAWHLHELWIYPDKAPFLPNETIRDLWQQGFVTVKKLDTVDNVGAYLTAYLCDVPLDECKASGINPDNFEIKVCDLLDDNGEQIQKKYVKGARVHLYPAKMNFYRTSRNIARPETEWTKLEKAKEKVKGATLTYSKNIRLYDDDNGFKSDISYEYYNKLRK